MSLLLPTFPGVATSAPSRRRSTSSHYDRILPHEHKTKGTNEYQRSWNIPEEIIKDLISIKCSEVLATKLLHKGLITDPIFEEAVNSEATESARIRCMIDYIQPEVYDEFIAILHEIDGIDSSKLIEREISSPDSQGQISSNIIYVHV